MSFTAGKRALILGGNGALGRAMVSSFKQRSWSVLNVDLNKNEEADGNIVIKKDVSL